MDAEAPTRGDHIKAGVFWLIVLLGLGYVVGAVLMSPNNGESTASDEPPSAVAGEAPVPVARSGGGGLAARLADVEARTACNVRLGDAARTLYHAGALYRWTETDLEARFGRRQSTNPGILVYFGNALEFMDEDGSWVRAFYECDWNTETGEVVDVRTR